MKIELEIPTQLAQVFDLLEITPQQVINHFMGNLSLDAFDTSGSLERSLAVEYFTNMNYHQPTFDFQEITTLFDQLDQIRHDYYQFAPSGKAAYLAYCETSYKALFEEFKQLKDTRK